jgi:vacuolar-type H+-ATPase subunit H
MSKIEQLITEIEEYIDSCKPQPFSNNKKIIVDKDEMEELLVELRLRTPEEIKKYQKILSNKEAILSDANRQAEEMLAQATQHTKELLDEHEIIMQAHAKADEIIQSATIRGQQIVDQATMEANSIREGSIRYTDDMLKSMQDIIAHTLEGARSRFETFSGSLQSSYQIVTANRRELAGQEPTEEEETEDTEDEA